MITQNIIAGKQSALSSETFTAHNPSTKEILEDQYFVATDAEIDMAAQRSYDAWHIYKNTTGAEKTKLLLTIADRIEGLGDTLVQQAMKESGLPEGRIKGERGRTCGQLRLFAKLLEEGNWVQATIDEADPDRKPMPKVDIRKMLIAIGPTVVFGASNFPLAFSTAGGDTASALASGCPVIVKGHPSHPGTHALVSEAITKAVADCNLPQGVYSSIQGGVPAGKALVQHPLVKAVAFTGSLKGGDAIIKTASQRPEPIPVYAEMGSINPIFILPQQLAGDLDKLAVTLANSINMGAGQFCTNPGVLVIPKSENTTSFIEKLTSAFSNLKAFTMLNEGIFNHYESSKSEVIAHDGVELKYSHENNGQWAGYPSIAVTDANKFINNKRLHCEVFGPFSLAVICDDTAEMNAVANSLDGQLTSTVMGSEAELREHFSLIDILTEKAGRVLFNGVPTGVEVGHAMHHGGPYPSASSSMYTSVGTDAIYRFVRPICYQNMPESILPDALKSSNPLGIWRKVNGELSK